MIFGKNFMKLIYKAPIKFLITWNCSLSPLKSLRLREPIWIFLLGYASYWFLHAVLHIINSCLRLKGLEMKIVEFANSVDPSEMAHNEPPQLNLLCMPFSLWFLNMI